MLIWGSACFSQIGAVLLLPRSEIEKVEPDQSMIPLICHLTNSRQLSCPQELYQVPEKELCRLRPEGKMAIPRIRVVTIPDFTFIFPITIHPTKMEQMKIQKDYNQLGIVGSKVSFKKKLLPRYLQVFYYFSMLHFSHQFLHAGNTFMF